VSYLLSFGAALPPRIVTNTELSQLTGRPTEWIWNVSGIEERRWADEDTSVADLGLAAAQDCLAKAGMAPSELGMILVSSGTSPRVFPGPASEIASRLGLNETPALDLPFASAGSLIAMSLAGDLAGSRGPVLVIASEIMSRVIRKDPVDPAVAILFGDGAGACIVHPTKGMAKVVGSRIATDGAFSGDLLMSLSQTLSMNGKSIILQASRKLPRIIQQVLAQYGVAVGKVSRFLMHQANQNLMDRVADALKSDRDLFYSNIRRYGNTSSASMLIAAKECWEEGRIGAGNTVCFVAFGAGLQWGCLLAEQV
jgi:3-oxoacyl-[acyl-carrier-protein] synthase-3